MDRLHHPLAMTKCSRFLVICCLLLGLTRAYSAEVILISDLQVPLVSAGKTVGSMTLKAGSSVHLEKILHDGILISRGDGRTIKVALDSVTAESLAIAMATPIPPPTPLASSSSTPASTSTLTSNASPSLTNQSPTPEMVNQALALNLFSTNNLWEEDAATIASNLNLPEESETLYESEYGYEPHGKKRIFGAECFSISLQGIQGKVGRISILFANKGDILHYADSLELSQLKDQEERSGGSGNFAPTYSAQMIQRYQAAIRDDQQRVTEALVKLFGTGLPARNFKTSWMSEEGTQWKWKGINFFLFAPRNEYLTLRIEPTSVENYLKTERTAFAAAKSTLPSRVHHRPNGDVIIEEIPMVDQGSKGYCVPATISRLLRFYNIEADMNMLAMAGKTDAGGAHGTSFDDILPTINELARNAGGLLNQQQFSGRISDIKQIIDSGKPIIWGLYSSEEFNNRMASRNAARKTVTDWEKWKTDLNKTRAWASTLPHAGAHCCMIIGYNENTREIALSDSWGPDYRERWMTEEEAAAIRQGSMASIGW